MPTEMKLLINRDHWGDGSDSEEILKRATEDIDLNLFKTRGNLPDESNIYLSASYAILKDIDKLKEFISRDKDIKQKVEINFPLSYDIIHDEKFLKHKERHESLFKGKDITIAEDVWNSDLFLKYKIEEGLRLLTGDKEFSVKEFDFIRDKIYGYEYGSHFYLKLNHDLEDYFTRIAVFIQPDENFQINFPLHLKILECIAYDYPYRRRI